MSIRSQPGPRRVAALGLVALMAAACSGAATSNPTATAAAPPANTTPSTGQGGTGAADACALVTAIEAQAAMGVPVATTSRVPLTAGNGSDCAYDTADGSNSLSVVVVGEDKDNFDLDFGARAAGGPGAPVTGVGSDAYFSVAGDTGTLAVWQNGTAVEIQITDQSGGTSSAQFQAAATKVALAALARL